MISTEEMRALEDMAEKSGVTKLTLMENAGTALANLIDKEHNVKGKTILVVCYHGNNGGDGFVCANILSKSAEVDVLFIGDASKFKSEALVNFNKIKQSDRIQFISLKYVDFDNYDIIIDAILGTGFRGELKYPIGTVIDFINQTKATKIAVDIPTGLDPDTGEVASRMVDADQIITFHEMKKGLFKFKDKTTVVDIGIPK